MKANAAFQMFDDFIKECEKAEIESDKQIDQEQQKEQEQEQVDLINEAEASRIKENADDDEAERLRLEKLVEQVKIVEKTGKKDE